MEEEKVKGGGGVLKEVRENRANLELGSGRLG